MKTETRALSFFELCDELAKKQDSLILFHTRPDVDAVGSAFALKLIIEALGAKAYCLCADELPRRLRFLTDSFDRLDSVGQIDSYRVITVDCGSASQLGSLYEHLKPSLAIDHHRTSTPFCDGYTDSAAAATAEIIYEVSQDLIERGALTSLPRRFYECVYAAISSDTGSFRYSNTTPNTHRIAAEIIARGIDAADINHSLFESKTLSELRASAAATDHLSTYIDGRVAVVAFSAEQLSRLEIEREHYDVFIDVARSLAGAEVAFSVRCAPGDRYCRVSMRSCGEVDVSRICAAFGGGGHIRAAGCTVELDDVNEVVKRVLKEIEKQL